MELLHTGRSAVIVLGFLTAFPAWAGDWNFEASLGNAKVDGGEGTVLGLPYDESDSDRAWRVGFSRHLTGPFSLQLDYEKLGSLNSTGVGYQWSGPLPIDLSQCPGPICTVAQVRGTWRVHSYALSGRADWSIDSGFGVFGRLGYAKYENFGTRSTEPVLALGVSYRVNDHLTLTGEITRHGYQTWFDEYIVSTTFGVRVGL